MDELQDAFVDKLATAVEIASVSADADRRGDVVAMGNWLQAELVKLGVE